VRSDVAPSSAYVTGARKLVGHCLDHHRAVLAGAFVLTPPSDQRSEADGVVRRFNASPVRVAVTALAVAMPLPLTAGTGHR